VIEGGADQVGALHARMGAVRCEQGIARILVLVVTPTWLTKAKMDEITVFDRGLTAAEVLLLYEQGGNPDVPSPLPPGMVLIVK
jgi:hypothetical protein